MAAGCVQNQVLQWSSLVQLCTLIAFAFAASSSTNQLKFSHKQRHAIIIFMPLSQFVAVWLIKKAHSAVLRAVTVPSTLKLSTVWYVWEI